MRFLLGVAVLCAAAVAQDVKPVVGPEVGNVAPSFRVNDDAGAMTEVGGKAKTWTLLAFYPKASTGG